MQVAKFTTTKQGRYLKFVALSEINGNKWTSAAEIGIQVAPASNTIGSIIDQPRHDEAVYDMQGRKRADNADMLSTLPKGIYIQNGKKMVR